MQYDKGQLWFEDELVSRSNPEDVDRPLLEQYRHIIGASELSDEKVLEARDFLIDSQLTNAGVLLFGKQPTRFLPSARVRVLKVDGTKLQTGQLLNLIKDVNFEGPLATTVERASQLIGSLLREFQVLGEDGRFRTVPEYPRFAWFEGLVNAVAHRDYSIRGEYIRVVIFDDRLEITSPGTLPNVVTLQNMLTTRFARNPKICHVLTAFELAREFNEGVHRMYEEMQGLGLPDPEYSEPNGFSVRLILRNNIERRIPYKTRTSPSPDTANNPTSTEDMTDTQQAALTLVKREGRVSAGVLARETGISRKTASKILRSLETSGLLIWHGSGRRDPTQYYSAALGT